MANPRAVLISDVHYNLATLPLADAAMRQAINKANALRIPLIVAGDLHDTKANLRGECVNAMLKTFDKLEQHCYILRGNHDAINEKSKEHSLSFLNFAPAFDEDERPFREVIDEPCFKNNLGAVNGRSVHLIPYQHDVEELKKYLKKVDPGSCIIMHQGLEAANMGEYIQDKSAINHRDVAGMRVISGHYHTRQTIQLPKGGTWDYIGNPYTLTFGEANDPEKGYQILYDDGSLEFVSTNLRKHVVVEYHVDDLVACPYTHNKGNLLLFKCQGSRKELATVTKELIASNYGITDSFRLELIPTDIAPTAQKINSQAQPDLLDSIIDSLQDTDERKQQLKQTWRSLL